MARIKLDMPARLLATVHIPVRISDINYGNHVGNDAFVSILHEARLQWLLQHGCTELNAGGSGLILSDLVVEFKQQSFYGDLVTVEVYLGEISRVGFELYYSLATKRNGIHQLLAHAKTSMICYNYETNKTVSIPVALNTIFKGN